MNRYAPYAVVTAIAETIESLPAEEQAARPALDPLSRARRMGASREGSDA